MLNEAISNLFISTIKNQLTLIKIKINQLSIAKLFRIFSLYEHQWGGGEIVI